MSTTPNKITCPSCSFEIDVNNTIYQKIHQELTKELDSKKQSLEDEKKNFELEKKTQEEKVNLLVQDRLKDEKKQVQEKVKKELEEENFEKIKSLKDELDEKSEKIKEFHKVSSENERLKREKDELKDKIEAEAEKKFSQMIVQEKEKVKKELENENFEKMKNLKDELDEKSEKIKEFHKVSSENERLKREKDELKDKIEAESEKKLSQMITEEREKIKKSEEEKNNFKLLEKQKLIDQLNNQLNEAKKKAEQGSIQLQGEVQEIAIETWLKENFPLDTIESIKPGARGGDCIQIVHTSNKQNCGQIYFESKRTKEFGKEWIEKFKADIIERGADVGVLVTEVFPKGMNRMGLVNGIWVCSFEEFKVLCSPLRESIIKVSEAVTTQENKGEKMNMLYSFLTSNEFSMQVDAIIEGFTQLKTDLEKEKKAMQSIWNKREKQIEKVVLNTTHMYSSIKGIAGSDIGTAQSLELPSDGFIDGLNV